MFAVQSELAVLVAAGPADVEWAAAGEQADGEAFEPIEAAIEGAGGWSDAFVG